MKKLEKLMSKWWFRLVLVAGFASILFLVNMILMTKAGDKGETHYANDGVLNISGWLIYLAIIPMYLATDILSYVNFKIGKLLRKLILLLSFAVCIIMVLIGLIAYIMGVKDGDVMRPVIDGFGIAPFLTYALLYHFVVGRYERINKEPNRISQFFVTILAYIVPIVFGIILVLILNAIDNSTVTLLVLIAILLLLVGSFVISIRKYGLLVGGVKEYYKEHENDVDSTPSSTSSSIPSEAQEWKEKIIDEINHGAYGTYCSVNASAVYNKGKIYVHVKIEYFGSSQAEIIASRLKEIASDVRSYYHRAAKKCPYSSKLDIEIKE